MRECYSQEVQAQKKKLSLAETWNGANTASSREPCTSCQGASRTPGVQNVCVGEGELDRDVEAGELTVGSPLWRDGGLKLAATLIARLAGARNVPGCGPLCWHSSFSPSRVRMIHCSRRQMIWRTYSSKLPNIKSAGSIVWS